MIHVHRHHHGASPACARTSCARCTPTSRRCSPKDGGIEYGPAVDARGRGTVSRAKLGPDTFVVVEKWASLDALKAHAAAPHMQAYGARTSDMRPSRVIHVLSPHEGSSVACSDGQNGVASQGLAKLPRSDDDAMLLPDDPARAFMPYPAVAVAERGRRAARRA